jgi:SAM-dependent methyltransferase
MIESLENALVRATEMIADPIQVRRIVISGKRRKHTPALTRIDIRPVEIKGAIHFQLVGHDGKQDTTKNLSPEGFSLLELMNEGFGNLLIETFDEELNVRVTKSGEAQVSLRKVVLESTEKSISRDLSHDRKKVRYLDESEPIFQALGISDHEGKLKPSRTEKFIQVNEFLKIIDQLPQFVSPSLSIVDLGCGNAYLTFAAHQFLSKKGAHPHTIGVDSREMSRKRNSEIARHVIKNQEIEFFAKEISDFPHREVDLTLALHACDTASDDALAWAINSKSKVILVAPCCHHDIQRQIKRHGNEVPESWSSIIRHGILRERVGDILTDAIRAQVMRILGYETDVIEFIASEHTPRNLLIRAVFTGRTASPSDFEALDSIMGQWHLEPHLVSLLSEAIAAQRHKALS